MPSIFRPTQWMLATIVFGVMTVAAAAGSFTRGCAARDLLHAQRRDTPDWNLLLKETLALTKMNWNGTQFDGALPITLKAARQVGDILKYVPDGTIPDPRYRFYM